MDFQLFEVLHPSPRFEALSSLAKVLKPIWLKLLPALKIIGPIVGLAILWIFLRRAYRALVLRVWIRHRVVHFELKPSGGRPEVLGEVASTFVNLTSNNLPTKWTRRHTTISIHRWTDGRETHLGLSIYGSQKAMQDANQIARATGCQAVEIGTSPIPETKCYAYAYRASFGGLSGFEVSPGKEFPLDQLAKSVGQQLDDIKDPAFLTVSFTPMSDHELKGLKAWRIQSVKDTQKVAGMAGANPWLNSSVAARGMVVAGAPTQRSANMLSNIASVIPDFESGLRAHAVNDRTFGTGLGVGSVVIGLLAYLVGHGVAVAAVATFGSVAAIVGAFLTLVSVSNILHISQKGMAVWVRSGLAPVPPRPLISALTGWVGGQQKSGIEEAAKDGKRLWHPYRTARRALVLLPQQLAVITALPPLSDTSAGVTSSRSVSAPLQVREAKGSRLGFDAEGNGVQIPDSNRSSGVMVIGDPGQGKSTILLWIFASDLFARMGEWRRTKKFHRAIIWFETKGEGAARALRVAERVGYTTKEICVIDATATTGPQLDLVDYSDRIGSANALAEAMRYAFEDNDIRAASESVLRIVIALALTIPSEVLEKAGQNPTQGFLSIAYKLVGGDPINSSRETILGCVSQFLGEAGSTPGDIESVNSLSDSEAMKTPLGVSYRHYKTLERSRRQSMEDVFSSPRNKIEKLLGANTLWYYDPNRKHISFQQILRHRMAVIVNFGSKDNSGFTDELRSLLGGLGTYLLWQAIKQECDDWDAIGDSVAIFADELADISGDKKKSESIDVIRLMHDSGRTRGVWEVFATQRLNQLGDSTASAIRSFDTKVILRLEDYEQAAEASRDVSGTTGDAFSEDDIRRLPKLEAIARERVGDSLPPPFTLHSQFDDLISPENITSPRLVIAEAESA